MIYFLQRIELSNFKNYDRCELDFHPKLNAILGLNGMGKTNLLDSIYYSCLGKSYFSSGDRQVVQLDKEFFRIESHFQRRETREKFIAKVSPGKKKELVIDGKKVEKISDHIGRYPVVIIAPDDIQLLLEGSQPRRNFLNHNLIQYDPNYTIALLKYNRLLKQRNALLKTFAERHEWNLSLLESITHGMIEPATYLNHKRDEMVAMMTPKFTEIYRLISGDKEDCEVKYKSHLSSLSLEEVMVKNLEKDRIMARTTGGIHKDDIAFIMNGELLKPFGSQGQLKTFVISIKLAQYHILKDQSNLAPILLLDDIFDKLDKKRVSHLLEVLHDESYGQVFLTDKDENDIPDFLQQISDDYAIFVIDEGSLKYSTKKG